MTVIAYDHKTRTLAVDSAFTSGERRSYGRKFKELDDGRVVVFAGDVREGRKAIAAIAKGEAPTQTQIANCTLIVMHRRGPWAGRVYAYDENPEPERITKSESWGTGGDFAIAALDAGATAEQAVKITCRRSTSCGGKVHVFSPET